MNRSPNWRCLYGFNDERAKQSAATSNHIRWLPTEVRPALELAIGSHLEQPDPDRTAGQWPDPGRAAEGRQGTGGNTRVLARAPGWKRWTPEIFAILDEQTVVVSGTSAPRARVATTDLALAQPRATRAEVPTQVESLVEASPLQQLRSSMAAVGVRTETRHPHRGPGSWISRLQDT